MRGRDDMGEAQRRRMTPRTDDDEAIAAAGGITVAELRELRRRLQEMVSTPEGMERFLTDTFGAENFTYDPDEDVWVVPNAQHQGCGRGFYIVRPNGTWFTAVVPEHEMS